MIKIPKDAKVLGIRFYDEERNLVLEQDWDGKGQIVLDEPIDVRYCEVIYEK